MVNKDFCLSSYMAYRYTYDRDMEYAEDMHHKNYVPIPNERKIKIKTANDIDNAIDNRVVRIYEKYNNVGILLFGGMDSAIVAAYLKPGTHAYTFTSNTGIFNADVERAKVYCDKWGFRHHLIEITFDDYKKYTPQVMRTKFGPVHSIEPQIYKAAKLAQQDGIEIMMIGDGADYVFGGMDKLLSQNWEFETFKQRYISLDPMLVLANPIDVYAPFEKYRKGNMIDFQGFMMDVCVNESYSSYENAFIAAGMAYCDPYENLIMSQPLDLERVRSGEPKYLIRELFSIKYPDLSVPTKIPMPRPVEVIFKDWTGPVRPEFRNDIPMDLLTGNQKWQLWCAELFLNLFN